jgi:LMBR1 domain-containing protein 1
MQIFLLISATCGAVLILFCSLLILVKFGHPDDKNSAWFPRAVVVFGLFLSFSSILTLPYDVAANNNYNSDSGISVTTLWLIIFILDAIMIIFVIPFAYFYYENEEDEEYIAESKCDTQICNALKYTLGFLSFFIILFSIMYAYLNDANIPVTRIAESRSLVIKGNAPLSSAINADASCNILSQSQITSDFLSVTAPCISGFYYWIIPVSFPLFIVAVTAFMGTWFFATFLGVGLFALPLDLINAYITRPTPISTKEYFETKIELGNRTNTLLQLGKDIQRKHEIKPKNIIEKLERSREFTAFEKHYYYLKKDYQMLHVAHKLRGGNPLLYFLYLFLGLISICISTLWYIHIAIFMLPNKPYSEFLNIFFIELSNSIPNFPLFGVCAFALFSIYLLCAVVKGNFRLGARFIIWKIFPMELNNTLTNAFLANTLIILLATIPAVQFCINAFPAYTQYTDANVMFGNQIQYLTFFRYFFVNNFFVIWILVASSLSILFIILFPNNKKKEIELQLNKLAKSSNTSLKDYMDEIR